MSEANNKNCCRFTGFSPAGEAFILSELVNPSSSILSAHRVPTSFESPKLVVLPNTEAAERLISDLNFFLGPKAGEVVCPFLSWEILPFDMLSPTINVSAERINTLYRILSGAPVVVVSTPEALMQLIVPASIFHSAKKHVAVNAHIGRDELASYLNTFGYQRSSLVEEVGQFTVRGAVLDCFPPGTKLPLRFEFYGDEIQSLRLFDPASQRSTEELDSFQLIPVRETFYGNLQAISERLKIRASEQALPLSAAKIVEQSIEQGLVLPGIEHLQPFFTPDCSCLWEFFPKKPDLILMDELQVVSAADAFESIVLERAAKADEEARLYPVVETAYLNAEKFSNWIKSESKFSFHRLAFYQNAEEDRSFELTPKLCGISNLQSLHLALQVSRKEERPFMPLAEAINSAKKADTKVAIVVSQPSRVRRVQELLRGYDIETQKKEENFFEFVSSRNTDSVVILGGALSSGFHLASSNLLLIPENEIFPEVVSRRETLAAKNVRRFVSELSQLKNGDYIVHIEHGIGIYQGLKYLETDGHAGDFLMLEYAEGAKLYLPVENIGKIQKYAGAGAKKPALSKLGGKAWNSTKEKVRENVAEIAGQLLQVVAERELVEADRFGAVDNEDERFSDSFPFEETADQAQAIKDVLSDLDRGQPMDRLVCGDVGYGKTEIALRAAFKVANSGKQVAVLVPTTILADQHFATFAARFADTPLQVGFVSRFQGVQENKRTLDLVRLGKIDIIIGTHRLLQQDVYFHDLGLIVIDEEHRFGVSHKEKLKRLRAAVHVLTLTATPIPRTLHMSLSGLRELSIIETPPHNRQVIRTYVAAYSESLVREAIMRELGRSGQVFYVYNRVQNIQLVADELALLVPEAKIVVGHGQMKEKELEEVMHRFISGQANVLVSTTIVESGLDISNANTIVIRSADKFGLAELYQLRGRVGRSSRRAYAYLMIPDLKTLGPDARRRLEVLQSLDDLGIGFRLALQDMEIRGAGNLLGSDQSGHIELVGFELYSRILKEVVEELRERREGGSKSRDKSRPEVDPEMRIGFVAYIPTDYVPDVGERLILYRRLIEIKNASEGSFLLSEIEDRFGALPEEVVSLVEVMVFRALLKQACIVRAVWRLNTLSINFHPEASPDSDKAMAILKRPEQLIKLLPNMGLSISIEPGRVQTAKDLHEVLFDLLIELGEPL